MERMTALDAIYGISQAWSSINPVMHCHNTPMEAQGRERMYSYYSVMTSALDGGE
jgi:hypothetical protein